MEAFEKLGSFYLGKIYDLEQEQRTDQYMLYDSKDLTTHAVCVGMTGSGKTGLCIGLLEEAAMDQIPALIIDPKGDMSNLLLSFPELSTEDFRPWVQASEAERKNQTVDEFAEATATRWKEGLEDWEIDGDRIFAMRDKVDLTVYTPGSSAGTPLSILRLVELPSDQILNDMEALAQYTNATVSSLLSLLGIDADPLTSREHILLSNILMEGWKSRYSMDLASLIQAIQKPEIAQVGVLPLETFYPANDRFQLAMRFNNLLASPQFKAWTEGEPLDIQNLLYTASGKPRISILSINHLSDEERMFFVSTFLNQVVSWVRSQSGTSSLRAILYMDEIFGYFPPVANPPSKQPLLTLLKQARAYGLGVVLTTQNPVDLDYKGLANIGTWFIGRLQTERDKARLIDGLQSASAETAQRFDRQTLDELLSNLKSRVFLVHNVHESAPEVFETRWAMSYLAGPLTRDQIMKLKPAEEEEEEAERYEVEPPAAEPLPVAAPMAKPAAEPALQPQLPSGIQQFFLPEDVRVEQVNYRPALYAYVSTAYNDSRKKVSEVEETVWTTPLQDGVIPVDWQVTTGARPDPDYLTQTAVPRAIFGSIPEAATKKTSYTGWEKDLKDHIYRENVLKLYRNEVTGLVSEPGESERDFVVRIHQESRELRDEKMEELRARYAKRIATEEERVRKQEQRVEAEKDQAKTAKMGSLLDIGSTIFGSLFSKNKLSRTTMNKAATAAKSASRAKRQTGDVNRAEETLASYQERLTSLEDEMQEELDKLGKEYDLANEQLETVELKPKKADINVRVLSVLWLPYDGDEPAFRIEE